MIIIATIPTSLFPAVLFAPVWLFHRLLQNKRLSNTQIFSIGLPLILLPCFILQCEDPLLGGSLGVWTTLWGIRVFEVASIPRETQQKWSFKDVFQIIVIGQPSNRPHRLFKNTVWTYFNLISDCLFFHATQWLIIAYFRKYGFRHDVYLVNILDVKQVVDYTLIGALLYSGMRAIHFWRFLPLIAFGEPIPVLYKAPYAAKSMRDLWANRWNLVAQASLERGIYIPTLKLLEKNPKIEEKQPPRYSFLSVATSTMVTFLVSGLQHELCVVHLMPEQPLGTTVAFFLLNGIFCILEAAFQRATGYGVNWGLGPVWKCLNWFLTLGTLITLSPLMLRPFIHSGLYFEKVPVPDPIIDFCQNWI